MFLLHGPALFCSFITLRILAHPFDTASFSPMFTIPNYINPYTSFPEFNHPKWMVPSSLSPGPGIHPSGVGKNTSRSSLG